MPRITVQELAMIQARSDAATAPAPWFHYVSVENGPTVQTANGWVFVASDKGRIQDAAFTAAACTDVPALVAEVRRLRGLLDAAYEATRSLDHRFDGDLEVEAEVEAIRAEAHAAKP